MSLNKKNLDLRWNAICKISRQSVICYVLLIYRNIYTFTYLYFRGSALGRRTRDRELEIQADSRDKQKEMEEIEEVLRKRMAGETTETKPKRNMENKENEVYISN